MHAMAVEEGRPEPLGAACAGDGVNFGLFSAHAERVELCLFDAQGRQELARLPLRARTGDVWHGLVPGLRPGQRYGYRVYGPYDPRNGHRFNPHKLLIDPYARMLDRSLISDDSQLGYRAGDPSGDLSFDDRDDAAAMPKCIVVDHAAADRVGGAPRPDIPWRSTVIYELHVRGMTKLHPDLPTHLRGTLAGLASPAVIAQLQSLGITAVELMPLNPIVDERHLVSLGLRNYWGYNPIAFFALEPRYVASDGLMEFRQLVRALHAAGIELIMDIVFNHTGETDAQGPTLSFRGIDNASYYRLDPDRRHYANHCGCGNTLNLEHPYVRTLVLDALRYWAEMGVDGFRFDLAVTVAREGDGFRPHAAILSAIAADPLLSRLKLIAEPWDVGPNGYQLGGFPSPWAEWNDRYRNTVRRFWRGDRGQVADLAMRLAGSSDVMDAARGPLASINHVTAHDGFTLQDLVSYDAKHNLPNGEGNADGTNENFSWNCGVEGPSENPGVRQLRFQQKRNLIATLFLSLGVPMMVAGDELGHGQNGNNNPYCQDNETTWIAWQGLDADDAAFLRFVRRVIALRREHAVFQRSIFLTGQAAGRLGRKDVVWLRPDGEEMVATDWSNVELQAFGCALDGNGAGEPERRYILMLNAEAQSVQFVLPATLGGPWLSLLDTTLADGSGGLEVPAGAHWPLAGRSLALLADRR
jgi:isoamylase